MLRIFILLKQYLINVLGTPFGLLILLSIPVLTALFTATHITAAEKSSSFNPALIPQTPTVLELFTSQGCHSCPPADKLLGELSENSHYIAISCHVTYWDYLGWKDSFSQNFCDKRQRQYNAYLKTGSNYTPQLIINGRFQTVGSREYRVSNALFRAKKQPQLIPIDVSRNSKSLLINLDELIKNIPDKRAIELTILGVGETQDVVIPRGENSGKTLTYHQPLMHGYTKALENIDSTRLVEKLGEHAIHKHWVVLAHDINNGSIVAAGQVKTPSS